MKHLKTVLVALTVLNTVLLVFLLAQLTPAHAQQRPSLRLPTVFTSPDFGFRIRSWKLGEPIDGTLLIRFNGQWHEVQADVTVSPAATLPLDGAR
jgi:hypothetical protein